MSMIIYVAQEQHQDRGYYDELTGSRSSLHHSRQGL